MSLEQVMVSNFGNTYGGLELMKDKEGNHYLEMDDCFGPSLFGPLNDDQIAAFKLLAELEEMPDSEARKFYPWTRQNA